MAYDPQQPPEDKKNLLAVIAHSFFVVPFILAVFSVLLFCAVRLLTMEKHSAYDYLSDVQEGGATKRWQSAFELSRLLANKAEIPKEEKFITDLSNAFEKSRTDDERVYQYLSLAMARTGDQRFTDVLIKNIDKEKSENLYAIISALGILADSKAVDVLLPYLKDDSERIRLVTVIALGQIGDTKAIEALKDRLTDAQINIAWDAAIALAKMGDRSGKDLILNMLSREYLNGFTAIDAQEQTKIIAVTIQAVSGWNDADINAILKKLFESDKNMNIRDLANKALKNNP